MWGPFWRKRTPVSYAPEVRAFTAERMEALRLEAGIQYSCKYIEPSPEERLVAQRLRRGERLTADELLLAVRSGLHGPSFSETVNAFMTQKQLRAPDVYHAARLDRRLFSRLVGSADYHPSRDTAICLAFGLRLSPDEADYLLKSAGYVLSRSDARDIAIEYFLVKGLYEPDDVDRTLSELGLRTLGRGIE